MPTEEFIIAVYCRVDEIMRDEQKHPQAKLYPSEVVTLALIYALKGVGERCRGYKSIRPVQAARRYA